MGIEAVFIAEGIVSPQRFTKGIYGNNLSRVAGEGFKQRVFFGGQGNDCAALINFCPTQINGAPLQKKQRGIRFVGSAQYCINSQQLFLGQKGLYHVIIGTEPQAR